LLTVRGDCGEALVCADCGHTTAGIVRRNGTCRAKKNLAASGGVATFTRTSAVRFVKRNSVARASFTHNKDGGQLSEVGSVSLIDCIFSD
jgi:hypothetical protein